MLLLPVIGKISKWMDLLCQNVKCIRNKNTVRRILCVI